MAQSTPIRRPASASPAASSRCGAVGPDRCGSCVMRPSSAFVRPGSASAWKMSRSSCSSTSSSIFRPPETTFSPLSSAGLCDAETMIPAACPPCSATIGQAGRGDDAELDARRPRPTPGRRADGRDQHVARAARVLADHHAAAGAIEQVADRATEVVGEGRASGRRWRRRGSRPCRRGDPSGRGRGRGRRDDRDRHRRRREADQARRRPAGQTVGDDGGRRGQARRR